MSIYCAHCGTENEEKYIYCKNCGAPLGTAKNDNSAQNGYKYDYYADKIPTEIDGIPSEEITHFVGNNKYKIIDKFAKMSFTGSKISWCWPIAVLSLIFGFFGSAIWLFYRKMYKYGAMALAAGFLITGIKTAVTYAPTRQFVNEVFNAFYELTTATNPDYEKFSEEINNAVNTFSASKEVAASELISDIVDYTLGLFSGLFGMYLYKNHAFKKISEYRKLNRSGDYYNYGLSAMGGTSVGMVFIAITAIFVINILTSIIPFFNYLF